VTESAEHSSVELRVPADSAFVAVLRSVTAGLAARCDLTLDEIEDLRIAVDEACALLLPLAAPAASLSADFTLATGELIVTVSVPTGESAELNRDGFGWTVLDALASAVETEAADGRVSISLTKIRDHSEDGATDADQATAGDSTP
jgi:serine/threonine-protein kinase RsbW